MPETRDRPAPKNIVVFSDGTGQEGGKKNNTNVYKLFNMVEDRTPRQIAFYDRGLGTGWRKISGSAFGAGMSKNIRECYRFIFDHYEAGDQVYLFGFSRGAFTVRSLSGFLELFGVLPKSRPELIETAYDIYRKRGSVDERRAAALDFVDKHHTMKCPVRFLGVWDTVGALGVPFPRMSAVLDRIPWFKHKFHTPNLAGNVQHACHALAIDDERKTFHPTLWPENDRVEQVWFAGMHSDVGGGYEKHALSDISLRWMTRRAMEHGLRIYPWHPVTTAPDPNGHMHDSRDGVKGMFEREVREWDETAGSVVVHASVLARTKNPGNSEEPPYAPWILQRADRTSGGSDADFSGAEWVGRSLRETEGDS